MTAKFNFPERIAMAGGLGLLASSRDGTVIAARPNGNARDPSPDVVLAIRGTKKPNKLRLDITGLFPAASTSPPITGLALVEHDGSTWLLAAWDDAGGDGAGIGIFDLDGVPRAIHWLLGDDARKQRVHQHARGISAMSGSVGMIRDLCVSSDRCSFALRIHDEVQLWRLSALLAGGAASAIATMAGRGLAIAGNDRVFTTFADPDGDCFNTLSGDGVVRRVNLSASPGIRVWNAAERLVTGSGCIFDADGQLHGKVPGEVWGACGADDTLVAVGASQADPQVWLVDAASLAVRHEQPAVGATSATKIAGVAGQHIAVGGKNCLHVWPWPLHRR